MLGGSSDFILPYALDSGYVIIRHADYCFSMLLVFGIDEEAVVLPGHVSTVCGDDTWTFPLVKRIMIRIPINFDRNDKCS